MSTGLAAKDTDNINCDKAKGGNEEIQKIMDNKSVLSAQVPTKLNVRCLTQLTKAVKLSTQVVHDDPAVLLLHLLVVVERAQKPDQYFKL